MDLTPIWGSLTIFLICPLLGGLPLIDWITYILTGRQLRTLGTGNISVSAAFYHGGKLAGIGAVLSEAAKGIIAVLLARIFFPTGSVWEIIAVIAVILGRYWMGKSAGTTNAVWGIAAHDAIAAGLVWLISLVSFTIIRDRTLGKYGALILLVIVIGLRHPHQLEYAVAAGALASLLGWIYQNIPDDLDLTDNTGKASTNKMFRFFQGDKNIITLDRELNANKVGQKAANLSLLKRQGYPVAEGWILRPGDDFKTLCTILEPSIESPLIVRSSAIGEDSQAASAAGQYLSILDVTDREKLRSAIIDCQASYLQTNAIEYRQKSRQTEESERVRLKKRTARSEVSSELGLSKKTELPLTSSMAILIQRQIEGVYSGVAFSRDPVDRFNESVAIEALPGLATKIVSGKYTPQRYSVAISDSLSDESPDKTVTITELNLSNDAVAIPVKIIESVAVLARELEDFFEGIPQDIEWTHDGEQLWLLQVRPITTLQPIWTRRIAAEVIPGKIRPLTWSINQPLTCGVWGKIFTIVLGDRAKDLNFEETATLHFASAYFNVTLLGTIFQRMGLPPESLEFLTRGAKFTKPPLMSTIQNLPGLWRLAKREWNLSNDFDRDRASLFAPILHEIESQAVAELSPTEIIDRINTILGLLDKVTYYNILAPLSLAIRQGLFKVTETELDYSQIPEVVAVSSLAEIVAQTRQLLGNEQITLDSCASLFTHIAENPEGSSILDKFSLWLDKYGYLSEVATDIAVPRWQDKPGIPRQMFSRFYFDVHGAKTVRSSLNSDRSWKAKLVQKRLNLKGQVAEVYNKLLAHLRWAFLALEQQWLDNKHLTEKRDIFLLKLEEIIALVENSDPDLKLRLSTLIEARKQQWQTQAQLDPVPRLVYGQPTSLVWKTSLVTDARQKFRGIGTSSGEVEGTIKVISSLQQSDSIDLQTIIVVPYTDAGWSPLLARAGGLISEVGGRLSHGAIVAREYNIPAVMDVDNATKIFQNGQRVRLNGQTGIIEIL